MKQVSLTLIAAFMLLSGSALAQFELGAQVRPRAEYRHGFKRLLKEGEEAAFFTEQRTRILGLYEKEKVRLGFSFQDVRIWGETGQINKSDALTSFHEAWGEYLFTPKLSFKAGRQEFDYDDARILGNLDWAAQGRSHDAILFKYLDSSWAFHAGFAFNQEDGPPEPAKLTGTFYDDPAGGGFVSLGGGLPNPKHLDFLWFSKQMKSFTFSALILNTGWQMPDTTVNFLWTLGINPALKINKNIKADGSFYYQTGKDRADKETSAWLGSVNLTYTGVKKVVLTLGGDYLSGTGPNSSPGESNAFEPLFGTNHKFYGWMDYFYVGNPHAQGGRTIGLIDPYIKSKITISSESNLMVHVHQFVSPVDILLPENANETLGRNLGSEVDLIYTHSFSKPFALMAGYSHMFATKSMEAIKGGDADRTNNWAWLMLIFKPSLFKI